MIPWKSDTPAVDEVLESTRLRAALRNAAMPVPEGPAEGTFPTNPLNPHGI